MDPEHVGWFFGGIVVFAGIVVLMLGTLRAAVRKELASGGVVTAADLEKHFDDRMERHEEWERKLSTASRDVLRELIESYHRQGLESVEQARRLAVRVASDYQALHDHLTALGRRVESLERRINHGNDERHQELDAG